MADSRSGSRILRFAVTGGRDHRITVAESERFRVDLTGWFSGLPRRWSADAAFRTDPRREGYILVLRYGNARGVDQEAARLVESWGYATDPIDAPWEPLKRLLGEDDPRWKAAGSIRNWQLLRGAARLYAFPGGSGTADCVRQAERMGVPIIRI